MSVAENWNILLLLHLNGSRYHLWRTETDYLCIFAESCDPNHQRSSCINSIFSLSNSPLPTCQPVHISYRWGYLIISGEHCLGVWNLEYASDGKPTMMWATTVNGLGANLTHDGLDIRILTHLHVNNFVSSHLSSSTTLTPYSGC